MKLEEVGHIFCTCDYALNNCMFYILTSTALALFELHSLFSDCVSMQTAEGRYKGNNHSVSSDIDTLPSHFTDLCNRTTKGNKFSLHGTRLACMYTAILQEVWRVGGGSWWGVWASCNTQAFHPRLCLTGLEKNHKVNYGRILHVIQYHHDITGSFGSSVCPPGW